jgi:hypothetical protein
MAQQMQGPETKRISIYGASDDLVEIRGPGVEDELDAANGNALLTVASESTGEAMHVVVRLEKTGCWTASPLQMDEEQPLPTWPMRIRQCPECSYAAELVLTVPADTTVAEAAQKDGDS